LIFTTVKLSFDWLVFAVRLVWRPAENCVLFTLHFYFAAQKKIINKKNIIDVCGTRFGTAVWNRCLETRSLL